MPANVGDQEITIKFFDPVDSDEVNRIAKENRKTGLYRGGYLTKISDVSVSLSPFICEIESSGGGDQVRISTGSAVTLTVSTSLPYVIIRWPDVESSTANYAEFLAVALGSIGSYDLVVGKCVFSGSTLTGFNYSERSVPNSFDLFLRVEPNETPNLQVRVRSGRVNFGDKNYPVYEQLVTLTPPSSDKRIDLIYVDVGGYVAVSQGTVAVSPVPPDYGGVGVVVAEVTLSVGQSAITESDILDVRGWVTGGLTPFKSGDLLFTSAASPGRAGWTDVSSTYDNKFIRISSGTPLTTGGNNNHTHTLIAANLPSHSHGLSIVPTGAHTHVFRYHSDAWEGGNADGYRGQQYELSDPTALLPAGEHTHVINQNDAALLGNSFTTGNVPVYVTVKALKKN